MAVCKVCGTQYRDEFEHDDDNFCIRCDDIIGYWLKETYGDLKTSSKAWKGHELSKEEFLESLHDYLDEKGLQI